MKLPLIAQASPTDSRPRPPLYARPWFISLLLATVTFLVFRQVTTFPFVEFDDQDYVVANARVQGGLSAENVVWAFGASYASNWHPITWISHMLDVELFGTEAAGPHLVNLLLHLGNTLLLFAFWRQATGALWRSAFVAALFALHPLHVESVAWISERKDVLSTFFALLTLLAYVRYTRAILAVETTGTEPPQDPQTTGTAGKPVEDAASPARPARFHYALAVGWFALGLMSKPMLVSLPLLLLLLDYWPLHRFAPQSAREAWMGAWALIREKIPFFGFSAASCLLTVIAQDQGGAVRSLARFSLNARFGNALVAYARYLGKTLWPAQLSLLYPHPGHWPVASVFLASLLLAGLCLLAWRARRRFPYALTGWYWFFISLVPVIGLIQVGEQSMADRYMYLPSIGLFAAAAWGGAEVLAGFGIGRAGAVAVAGLALAACTVRTMGQLPCWRDTESLYRHALAVTGNNPGIQRFLAFHYYNLGNAAKEAGHLEEAIANYHRSMELDPQSSLAHNNLGMALQNAGRLQEAIPEYFRAIELSPTNANARNNIGVALAAAGNLDEAIRQFSESVRLVPNNPGAHNNLGALLFRQGKFAEAVTEYAAAARLAPGNPAVHDNLGDALARLGRTEEATACYRRALQLDPNDPVARKRLSSSPAPKPGP